MPNTLPQLLIGNKIINRETKTKFLGITMNYNLTWNSHVQEVLNKISRCSGIISQVRHCLTSEGLMQLYYTLVYCNNVWGGAGICLTNSLYISQKKVIRKVSFLKKFDHTNPAYISLKVLKYKDLSDYCAATLVFKTLNTPNNTMFQQRTNGPQRLRNSTLLLNPITHSAQAQTHISYRGVKVWNSLPESIRLRSTMSSFKKSLKQYYLNQYTQ